MDRTLYIGITGHRNLRKDDIPRLRELVRGELEHICAACPHHEVVMLDSLAAGADLLCAEEAAALGIPIVCPLPLPAEEYSSDFDGEDLSRFRALLAGARSVFVAPDAENGKTDRDYHYRQAGLYIVSHCSALLALWDGEPPRSTCGTAEMVRLMKSRGGTVIHLPTPRESSISPDSPQSHIP